MSERPQINKDLLNEVMEVVEEAADHELWDQSDWMRQTRRGTPMVYKGREFCGTACCFAGWTAMLDGWEPEVLVNRDGDECVYIRKGDVLQPGYRTDYIAQELLGLTDYEANRLFAGNNSLEDLKLIIKDFTEGERR